MTSYIPALVSILPKYSTPSVSPLPEIGDAAPSAIGSVDLTTGGSPALVAFVRHCGCPFAEKEVRLLAEEVKKNEASRLRVVVVQHSDEATTKEWWGSVGGPTLFPSDKVTLVADPERKIYAAWGVGQLGWGGMINGSVMETLSSLKEKESIDLRPTGKGSYRWQNSGGFAIDKYGKVRWRKIATQSSDMCDYAEAARTVVQDGGIASSKL